MRSEALRALHYLFATQADLERADFKAMLGMEDVDLFLAARDSLSRAVCGVGFLGYYFRYLLQKPPCIPSRYKARASTLNRSASPQATGWLRRRCRLCSSGACWPAIRHTASCALGCRSMRCGFTFRACGRRLRRGSSHKPYSNEYDLSHVPHRDHE